MSVSIGSLRSMKAIAVAATVGLVTLTGFAAPLRANDKPPKLDKETRKARAKVDKLYPMALKSGSSIIVVSTLALDQKYPDEQAWDDNLADEVDDNGTSAAIDMGLALEWADAEYPDSHFVVGRNSADWQIGIVGSLYTFRGKAMSDYKVFVVSPGTYTLRSINYPRPRSSFDENNGTVSARNKSPVGEIRMVANSLTEAAMENVWQDADVKTVAAREECTYWYKGGCTQSVYTPEQKVQTRAAGIHPKRVLKSIPALDIGISLDPGFASFTVNAGEVLLVDGLVVDPLTSNIAVDQCRGGESMQICKVGAMEVMRLSAALDDVRAHDFNAAALPQLGKILANIQYRPLQMNAEAIGKGKYGDSYRLTAQK